ncbi:MAG: glycine cleavage system protein GcvH [Planctomycetota bacterium]|nr:glycine cleavage system protein GcvH [Planctomycetota bacterium]
MPSPAGYRFSESHEWHNLEGDTVTLGLSKHAVNELTDVTYVEMKPVGFSFEPGDVIGEVESVKATSEIYSSVGGEIIEVNEKAHSDPSVINSDPHGDGWLVKIKVADPAPLESLMDAKTYDSKHPTD